MTSMFQGGWFCKGELNNTTFKYKVIPHISMDWGNREELREYHRKWRIDNRERIIAQNDKKRVEVREAISKGLIVRPVSKVCKRCGVEKGASEFWNDYERDDGISPWCRTCKGKDMVRWRVRHPERVWAKSTLVNHGRAGYEILMSRQELEEMALKVKVCPIDGVKLAWGHGRGKQGPDSPSLDRIDNGMVIRADTVQIVCLACNTRKGALTMSEFVDYCRQVAKKFGGEV